MEHLLLLSEILIINLVLSGDNAVVIAMASKNLPLKQRKRAVWWGALGAVLLRCVLTWVAVLLLKIPFIHAAGGVLLAAIAVKLLLPQEEHSRVAGASSLWKAVQTILAADFIMSLDNVLAIAALAEGDVSILVIGIAISIPIVVWGSNLIADWLQRLPILVYAGAGILGYTAGDMLLQDPQLGPALAAAAPALARAVPAGTAAVVIMFGWLRKYNAGRS
ncbi:MULTISPECIES: TerC family protein [Paenibacillus]|uniref:YjbE family integral membrane protein n=3 Tax=Paenibacillus TaxID=44249 RepID=R9LGF2_9BACL|nr:MULTISPECIES: TerC family protein [Paenibacillus]EOS57859.1 YjbE family integral membrane protein [Paenibacillus barengoltzii G22]MEC2344214.1 TerC family protein [Paenibacillus barengoltzii]SMF07977.1 integral membrane protein, YjbE family [Paenibacillus barengoltzii]SMF40429.1 integral membrane protein, YjbE family [Paenibacillus barengoltzii J12]